MSQRASDTEALARLGYAQALLRGMGGFSNFALSLSVISVLTGAVTLYGHGLSWGGPLVMTLGWPLVALLTLPLVLSLAELASAFPTAGALYHWSAILGGRGAGYFAAWLNTLGQFAITAAIDYGLAEFLVPMLGLPATREVTLALYGALLLSHGALNHVGVRAVHVLGTVSAWYHLVGVLVIVGGLAWAAPLQPLGFLGTAKNHHEGSLFADFLFGLLQAAWTFTGYDASAHATEETHDAARNAPRGMIFSVVVSAVAGWALLLLVTLAIPDLEAAVAAPNPFIFILTTSAGTLGTALVWLCMGAMWFCGLASVTSNSRMLFAFARDGGLPFSSTLARVSPRFASPHLAVWVSVAMAFGLAVWSGAYAVMTALSTIALYLSYAIPIGCGLWARRRGAWTRRGPFNLGRWSTAVNVVALAWVLATSVMFVLPPNELAGQTLAGVVLALVLAWRLAVAKRFAGPRVSLQTLEQSSA